MTRGTGALELKAIHKRFGSTVALAGATLSVRTGSLHMLVGENGAGKTTLLQIAAGLVRADEGEVVFGGRSVRWKNRGEALRAGLAVVHQHFSLVPAMTVAENVALVGAALTDSYSPRAASALVTRVAEAAGLRVNPAAVVAELSVAAQQRVEITKAIAKDAALLMLDEPTAMLSPSEGADLFIWLREFVNRGHTVVVITHKIREALDHADAITVLRGGQTVLTADRSVVTEQMVLDFIMGEGSDTASPTAVPSARGNRDTSHVLELVAASATDDRGGVRLAPTSLAVHAGEVVGVAGVDGAGQRELLRLLAGRLQPTSGTVHHPAAVGFIPDDRLREALAVELPLVHNFALRGAGSRRGLSRWRAMALATTEAIAALNVRAENAWSTARSLSGGNQQKFVLARELNGAPLAVIAENPTRGLDVRASQDVLARLRRAAAAGAAVVIYSTDIDELLTISDRIVVCHAGTVHDVPRTRDAIGAALVGAS